MVVGASLGFLDRSVYAAATRVARDPSAGEVARVQAFRVLLSQVSPDSPPTYEDLAQGMPADLMFDWAPTFGEPLPAGYRDEVATMAARVLEEAPSALVREAALVVQIAAEVASRRK